MNIDDFAKLKKKDLRRLANESFKVSEAVAGEAHISNLLRAQFYVAELERRANSWISIRDLILEIIVILLIGGEIYLGWKQGKELSAAFDKIEPILANLQTSSAATAKTLLALQSTTETMNGAIQKEVALFYDVQINVVYDEAKKKLVLINKGRTRVTLWSAIVGDQVQKPPQPQVITPDGTYEVSLEQFMNFIASTTAKGANPDVRLDLHVTNERNERFTVRCLLTVVWHGDTMAFNTHINGVMPGWETK